MQLPQSLQAAIENISDTMGLQSLVEAREELTRRYARPADRTFMTTDAQRYAYIFSRLPATYASLRSIFSAIRTRAHLTIESVLDLGAGPGTGVWAACESYPEVRTASLFERDDSLAEIGKKLAVESEYQAVRAGEWYRMDLEQLVDLPPHDLLVFSYSIGELAPEKISTLIDVAWKSAQKLLLVVEPGTPVGFERIRKIRKQLIERGANLLAPCPHALACPMADGDWCHFSARVERTSLHRRLKSGSLGHEDEKFSYIVATKEPYPLPASRVLRHPLRHSGHVILTLCTSLGVQQPTVSKKMGEVYKQARKVEWGDEFP